MPRNAATPVGVLVLWQAVAALSALWAAEREPAGRPWRLHVIDASSQGADGVRLADVNGDRLPDIATGWEEGGITRLYIHPGYGAVAKPWPAVTVGKTPSVEDAVPVDLDADGRIDVVSCCEGGTRTMFVHWAPDADEDYLDPAAWKTEPIPASQGAMMWMFCAPAQIDGRHGVDLVAGGKGGGAEIGWMESPSEPRRLDRWTWRPIAPAGWLMSLRAVDFDGDGDRDVVVSDRRGPLRGCRWLENPGPGSAQFGPWENHFLGGRQREVMFMTVADLDADGADDVLAAVKPQSLLCFRGGGRESGFRDGFAIAMPPGAGSAKGVAIGDVDGNGRPDVVFSCEGASGDKSGVMWLCCDAPAADRAWQPHEISGPAGIKFDRIELLDLDGDGDLDVLTCEESQPFQGSRRGLGVIWYENPAASAAPAH
ncbi:MAG: VCBS repeat-containing protein [Pirellulales bacterium]|nr:VCBS repeat-containing protein [Pirellulales bacterium]